MDPVRNPFAPGAGSPPPELAGRRSVIDEAMVALRRTAQGRPSQSMILVGLRGVGKTVLLNHIQRLADEEGYLGLFMEAHEGKALSDLFIASVRSLLYRLSTVKNARKQAQRALRVLASFLRSVKVTIGDIEIGLGIDPEIGVADSGDIEADLPDLFLAVGEAARAADQAVAIFIDELQYLNPKEFSALVMALHRVNQTSCRMVMIGAGLPQIHALAGNSKSYAERLFRFPTIGALSEEDAIAALANPAAEEGVTFKRRALEEILARTRGYPYYLQQWGYEAWNLAPSEAITYSVVLEATTQALDELDQSFFRVRFDRCTKSEQVYMRALADLGPEPQKSGAVAKRLGVKVSSVGPVRSALIRKGMLYAPAYGETAFTVPLFDQYLHRIIPHFEPPTPSPKAAL